MAKADEKKLAEKKLAEKKAESLLHDATISPRDTRRARGETVRAAIPMSVHSGWKVPPNRPDPVELLDSFNKNRVPELVPIRWGRMLASPFTFFRGSAALMAWDLGHLTHTGIYVQACGDSHLLNYGAFATPERNIVFDINDFDETLPAPWEWDVKRLATSFVLVARDNGVKEKHALAGAEAVARSYREKTAEYSKMSILDIWYARIDWPSIIDKTSDSDLLKERKKRLKEAMKRTIRDYYFPKLTEVIDGVYLIKDSPPTIFHMAEKAGKSFKEQFVNSLAHYKESLQEDKRRLFDRYQFKDVAIKVVGIGSVGTVCAVALMMARDDEPLLLQLKEASQSVLAPYAGKSEFSNHGQRVVAGQRIVQAASDIFLGWTEFDDGRQFYIRQLRDTKVKLEAELWEGDEIVKMAEVMGAVLARAHARSGDATFISGYIGDTDEFDRAIADFAIGYADQAEKDHAALEAAVRSGRIKAEIEKNED